jgi:nucleotide-binding universal stress UspA family protein
MNAKRTVLLPLDGSPAATVAIPVAETLARMLERSLHVLHVSPEPSAVPQDLVAKLGIDPKLPGGVVVHSRVGDPAELIVRVADEFQQTIIVLCTHTGMRGGPGALGPVAERVVTTTSHPVVLVPPTRGTAPWDLRTILVPHDGQPGTTSALAPAFELAHRADANLWALHVASPGAVPMREPGALATPRYVDQQQHEWPAWATEFVERLTKNQPGQPKGLRLSLAHGEPASAIAHFAVEHSADLVVLCSHGVLRTGRAAVLQAVLRDAPGPVLLLRCGGHS